MNALFLTPTLRALEATHAAKRLMERAGEAAAQHARQLLPKVQGESQGRVLVLAGPGNNGGDGVVCARWLMAWGVAVRVLRCFAAGQGGASADAAAAWSSWAALGGQTLDALPADDEPVDVIVDALLGIGASGAPRGRVAEAMAWANARRAARGTPVLALDVPSGLDADTGCIAAACGDAHAVVMASHTLTLLGDKPGLHTADGVDCSGQVHCDTLGVEGKPDGWLITELPSRAPARRRNSHKGDHGTAAVVGGGPGMQGAALLAAQAALLVGAGKVYCAFAGPPVFSPLHVEVMQIAADDLPPWPVLNALVIGPGMGQGEAAQRIMHRVLGFDGPRLIDADGLNLLAQHADLRERLTVGNAHHTVLTPHPGEAARLLAAVGLDANLALRNRIEAAKLIAQHYRAICVLKGAGSVIADRDGAWSINASGHPALAVAGMGDVLSGIIGGLLLQRLRPLDAVRLGVFAHGRAGESLAQSRASQGILASEVAWRCREVLWGPRNGGRLGNLDDDTPF